MIFGYARISRKEQKIERQMYNIRKAYPEAKIYCEVFTGTKIEERPVFSNLLKMVESGDTIVFDSVSRMSRNEVDGTELYFELFEKGVSLVFLKESYIDTEVYRRTIEESIGSTGNEIADIYIEATNRVIKLLATEQIKKAFEQAQKEVDDLHQRTREGMREAKARGAQIGHKKGTKITTKKSVEAKKIIKQMSKDFGGVYDDKNLMLILKGRLGTMSRNSFYKYKKELLEE